MANVYLAAVRSHDVHTAADQAANRSRVLFIYDWMLATAAGIEPLVQRLSETEQECECTVSS